MMQSMFGILVPSSKIPPGKKTARYQYDAQISKLKKSLLFTVDQDGKSFLREILEYLFSSRDVHL